MSQISSRPVSRFGKPVKSRYVPDGWKFSVDDPDFLVSPYTGMTRRHWADAAAFLLEGAFAHVKRFTDPLVFPKTVDIAYPKRGCPPHVRRSEEMEGVVRTMILAAPLLAKNPGLKAGGFPLCDYYAEQILRMTDEKSPRFIGRGPELGKRYGGRTFQQTCESALLSLNLTVAGDALWPKFSPKERDRIASVISSWAHFRTQEHNWRCFNLLMLTFLRLNGYEADEMMFRDHLAAVLSYYGGEGWYRDGNHFDYYSTWLFNLVLPIWCSWYGYEFEPTAAQTVERNHHELMETLPFMAGRRGEVLMWGRSSAYRYAGLLPFMTAFFLKEPGVDPGEARAVMSKSLLHFIGREDMFLDGVPTLGLYRTFPPMVQPYNCSGSVYFIGLPFLCLALPETSPFWTARERNEAWDSLGGGTRTVTLDGPGLSITDYGRTGAAEIRPGKVLVSRGNTFYLESYSRLSFNTSFPWESGKDGDVDSMNYSLILTRQKGKTAFLVPNLIAWAGERDGVLYRRAYFEFRETLRGLSAIDLAEIVLPFGVIRVDRARLLTPGTVRLGHYGLPHERGQARILRRSVKGCDSVAVSWGGRKLALTAVAGWDELDVKERSGVNPVMETSSIPFLSYRKKTAYSGLPFFISVMLHRTDDGDWTDEELQPVVSFTMSGFTRVELTLVDGSRYTVDFSSMEGHLSF